MPTPVPPLSGPETVPAHAFATDAGRPLVRGLTCLRWGLALVILSMGLPVPGLLVFLVFRDTITGLPPGEVLPILLHGVLGCGILLWIAALGLLRTSSNDPRITRRCTGALAACAGSLAGGWWPCLYDGAHVDAWMRCGELLLLPAAAAACALVLEALAHRAGRDDLAPGGSRCARGCAAAWAVMAAGCGWATWLRIHPAPPNEHLHLVWVALAAVSSTLLWLVSLARLYDLIMHVRWAVVMRYAVPDAQVPGTVSTDTRWYRR